MIITTLIEQTVLPSSFFVVPNYLINAYTSKKVLNTELNDLRKLFIWENLKFLTKEFQVLCHWKICGAWHTLFAMLLYQWHYISDTVETMMSYSFQYSLLTSSGYLSTAARYSLVSLATDRWRHWWRSMADSEWHTQPILMALQAAMLSAETSDHLKQIIFLRSLNSVFSAVAILSRPDESLQAQALEVWP